MDARTAAVFVGLAAFAGVAWASRRASAPGPAAPAEDWGFDVLPSSSPAVESAGGEWGASSDVFGAAEYVADALGSVLVIQQSLSYAGLQQLAEEEGFSATPYPDHKGYSIGHGHLIKPGEDLQYVTRGQAQELLLEDVGIAERAVRTAVDVELSQSQFDALVLLAYNIGGGAFRGSTLVRKLNAGDVAGAAAEFPRWNRASGQVNSTLVARRARERALFEA